MSKEISEKLKDIENLLLKVLKKQADEEIEELSLTKTASLLHISSDTLKQYAHNGIIRALNDNGKLKFRRSDIKEFQDSRVMDVLDFDGEKYFHQLKEVS
jgi:hypothetical protein